MKLKLFALCTIIGGVICATNSWLLDGIIDTVFDGVIPIISLLFVGIVFLAPAGIIWASSFYAAASVYSNTIWGMKIKTPKKFIIMQVFSFLGAIYGGFFMLYASLGALIALFNGRFVDIAVLLLCYWVPLVLSFFVVKKIMEKALSKETHALHLGELPIFKEIDANIGEATSFVVAFEGVALFSKTNYCYAVYRYEDYQLGDLATPNEVAMVGTYFVQKYYKDFTFKVDSEVIPGEPGQTIVAVGSGGVTVGRTSGVPDQRIFRSYIFTRRK